MAPSKLAQCLMAPNRIVSKLNWRRKGAIMALHITDKNIGMAFAPVPSKMSARSHGAASVEVHQLNPIPYMPEQSRMLNGLSNACCSRREVNQRLAEEFDDLVRELDVNCFIVSWPVKSNGKMGKQCGKVLHLLDSFAEGPHPVVTETRPFTLWDMSMDKNSDVMLKVSSNKRNPINDWLISEKMLRVDLERRERIKLEQEVDDAKDESQVASNALIEFVHHGWDNEVERSAAHLLEEKRNQMLLDSFFKNDSSDTVQMSLVA